MSDERPTQYIYKPLPSLVGAQESWPAFAYLSTLTWRWTELIVGRMVRVIYQGAVRLIEGHSYAHHVPDAIIHDLGACVPNNGKTNKLLPDDFAAVFFIQAVGESDCHYGRGLRFYLIDANVSGHWQDYSQLEEHAEWLGVPVTPIMSHGTPERAITTMVARSMLSSVAIGPWATKTSIKGLILRPLAELSDVDGKRLIVQITAAEIETWSDERKAEALKKAAP